MARRNLSEKLHLKDYEFVTWQHDPTPHARKVKKRLRRRIKRTGKQVAQQEINKGVEEFYNER